MGLFNNHPKGWEQREVQRKRDQKSAENARNQELKSKKNEGRSRDFLPENTLDTCPYCGSDRLTVTDRLKNGYQRYRCNACRTSVSPTIGTLAHKSNLSKEQVEQLHNCYQENKSIREAEKITGLNKNTVWRWFGIFKDAKSGDDCINDSYNENEYKETESDRYQTINAYALHDPSKVDSETTSKLIKQGKISKYEYVDKNGDVRGVMNRKESHISEL